MSYATAFTLSGFATPLLVKAASSVPTRSKATENIRSALGGTDVFAQASILDLTIPTARRTVTYMSDISILGHFCSRDSRPAEFAESSAGLGDPYFVAEHFFAYACGPDAAIPKEFPQAKWHVYEPVNRDNVYAGAQMAFGQPVETSYDARRRM